MPKKGNFIQQPNITLSPTNPPRSKETVRAVCLFLDMKFQHFLVKKGRLIKRIQNSDAPDKALFLSKLK